MSNIIRRDRCRDIIVLNIHVPTENKIDEIDSFYEEYERVVDKFPKYRMEILLGDFTSKVDREDILKATNGNESLREISNDNGVSVVNFDKSKNVTVKAQCSDIVTFVN
jgi:hypothetical protein